MTFTDLTKYDGWKSGGEWDLPPTTATKNPEVNNRDLGDRSTWLLIGLMCAAGLFIALVAYLLPLGQHATMPSIAVR